MHDNELFEGHWDIEFHHVAPIEEAGDDAADSRTTDDNENEAEEAEEEMVPIFPLTHRTLLTP